ncbi:hypothetical protein ZWY2020_019721, partial [Hordeum vulgare]
GTPVSTEPGDTLLKDQCCQELDEAPWHCRYQAVRYFIGRRSHPDWACSGPADAPRSPQRTSPKVLVTPGQCNVLTVHNAPILPRIWTYKE